MPTAMVCPGCGKRYQVPEKLRGKAVRCRCGQAIQVPAAVADPPQMAAHTQWLADELDALQQAGHKAAEPAAQEAYRPPRADPLAGYKATASADRGSTGRDLLLALLASGGILLLALVIGGIGIWYISTHPVAGASAEDRSAAWGSGLGTLTGLCLGLPWIVVALRYHSRRQS